VSDIDLPREPVLMIRFRLKTGNSAGTTSANVSYVHWNLDNIAISGVCE